MSDYAAKPFLKEATGIDTSTSAKKGDLSHLKSNVEDLDFDKLKTVPVDSES